MERRISFYDDSGLEEEDYFEPNDYDGDIGSATVEEMRIQNEL